MTPTRRTRKDRKDRKDREKKTAYGRIFARRKVCKLCTKDVNNVDYKDTKFLKNFMAQSGKILTRRTTGSCQKHQRILSKSIKRARNTGLLPFIVK